MKIKNFFIFICLMFLSLFMLTSCGDKDDDGDGGDNGNNGNQTSYLTKDELVKLLYNVGANYTLTAVDSQGYTTVAKYNGTVRDNHITSLEAEISVSTSNQKTYMDYKNNHAYIISLKNGKYVGEEFPSDYLFEYFDFARAISEEVIVDFGYDKDLGAYRLVYKEQDGSRSSVLCYIENNRLVKAVIKDGDWEATISYSNYGTTIVDLPEYEFKEENEELDLISLINKYEENFTLNFSNSYEGQSYNVYYKFDGNAQGENLFTAAIQITINGVVGYYTFDYGELIEIRQQDGAWVGKPTNNLSIFVPEMIKDTISDYLDSLDYNEETGAFSYSDDEKGILVLVEVSNGHITRVYYSEAGHVVEMTFSNFGNTTVRVPKYQMAEVEENNLKQLLSQLEENYTCTITSVENGQTSKLKMMVNVEYADSDYSWFNIWFSYNGTEAIYQYLNDRLVLITYVGDEYIGTVQDIKDFEIPSPLQEILPYADLFEYDSVNEKYIYSDDDATITITISDGHIGEITIIDGDSVNTCQYSNYGTTVVRIPNYKILVEEEESELSLVLAKPIENAKISIHASLQGDSMDEELLVDASYDENNKPISFKAKLTENEVVTYLYYDTDEEELLCIEKIETIEESGEFIAKDADEYFDDGLIEFFINPKKSFGESIDLFEYDLDKQCYKMEKDKETIKIFITDGVITKIIIEEIMEGNPPAKLIITVQFSEFGQVVVEIPPFQMAE